MTNQDNKIEKKQKKREKKFLKLFLLITLLGIFGAYLIMQASPALLRYIYPNETVNTKPGAIDDSYSVGLEPPLYLSGDEEGSDKNMDTEENSTPEIEVHIEPEEEDVEEVVNPYIEIIDVEAKAFDNSVLKAKFNDYRIFISNANKLLGKYRANQSFTTELNIFKDVIHPTHINETIKLLESYNTLLGKKFNTSENQVNTDTFLKKLFAKFVKIKKIEPDNKELLEVKANIDERLDTFTDYIYSQKLQDSLVK